MHDSINDLPRAFTLGLCLLAACDPAKLGTIPGDESSSGDASGDATQGNDDPTAGDPSMSSDPSDPTESPTSDAGEDDGTSVGADPSAGEDEGTTDSDTGVSCDTTSTCDPQPNYLSQGGASLAGGFLPGSWTGVSSTTLDTPCSIDDVVSLGGEDVDLTLLCEGIGATTLSVRGVPAEVLAQFPIGLALLLDQAIEDLDLFDGQSIFLRVRDAGTGEILLAYGLGQQPGADLRLFPMIDDARDTAWYGVAVAQDDDVCAPEPAECENILLDTCADASPVQRLGVRFDDSVTVVDAGEAQLAGDVDRQLEVAAALRTADDELECPRAVAEILVARR